MAGNLFDGALGESGKLDYGNYTIGKVKMRAFLIQKGLWDVVNVKGANLEESSTSSGSSKNGDWEQRDAKALSYIILSIKDSMIPHVSESETAKEAWDTLRNILEASNNTRKIYLRNELYSLQMRESSNVSDHITAFKRVRDQLVAVGELVQDSELVSLLLRSLSSSFSVFATSVRTRSDALSFEVLCGMLYQEELAMKSWSNQLDSDPKALLGINKKKEGCTYCHKLGHEEKDCRRKLFAQNKCFQCGKKGHKAKDCPSKEKELEEDANVASSGVDLFLCGVDSSPTCFNGKPCDGDYIVEEVVTFLDEEEIIEEFLSSLELDEGVSPTCSCDGKLKHANNFQPFVSKGKGIAWVGDQHRALSSMSPRSVWSGGTIDWPSFF